MEGSFARVPIEKNEERKRRREKKEQLVSPLTVSLPIEFYFGGHVQSSVALLSRLPSLPLTSSRTVASTDPLSLCKLRSQQEGQSSRADVTISVGISSELGWSVFYSGKELTQTSCLLLAALPHELTSAAAVCHLMSVLDSAKVCAGNSDEKFLKLWHHRALTLHGSQNPIPGVLDRSVPSVSTVQSASCQLLLPGDSIAMRC